MIHTYRIGPNDGPVARMIERHMRIVKRTLADRPKSRTPLIGVPSKKPVPSGWRGYNQPKTRIRGCF